MVKMFRIGRSASKLLSSPLLEYGGGSTTRCIKPPSPSKCGYLMIATSVSQQLYEYLATLNADKQIKSLIQICNKCKMKSGDLLKTYCNNVERIILMFYKTCR